MKKSNVIETFLKMVVVLYLSIVALFAAILCFIRCVVPKIKLDIPSPKSFPIVGHVPYMIGLNNEGENN